MAEDEGGEGTKTRTDDRAKRVQYKELSAATKGFHSSRIIGRGAFGNVYEAYMISIGILPAVKRSKHLHEGKAEFLAELSITACLRHKNLVQLQSWCAEKGEVLLLYEFMPYGSLDSLLYQQPEKGTVLSWSLRQSIAVGLASALTCLHLECEQQVIHRDIKTSNIMLDANFSTRLGDFGLATLMEHDKSPVSTLTAGSMEYLAPEYMHCGKATEKTDVFSYGVVILELACGRRPIEREPYSQRMVNLVDWIWGLYGEGKIIEVHRMVGQEMVESAGDVDFQETESWGPLSSVCFHRLLTGKGATVVFSLQEKNTCQVVIRFTPLRFGVGDLRVVIRV